jgi:hypothetical protein
MVYTAFEMIRDCRADRPEGWDYFIRHYIPLICKMLSHYGRKQDSELDKVLATLRDPGRGLFSALQPVSERPFVAHLRQKVLETVEGQDPPGLTIELETLAAALVGLTLVEEQAVWLETMRYPPAEAGTLLRMRAETVARIRAKAAERIRGGLDGWSITILAENGLRLGGAASAAATGDCLPAKVFLDIVDGRTAWQGRESMEGHVRTCWHCIDHYCRLLEAAEWLRTAEPLSEQEAEPFRRLLGAGQAKQAAWRRLLPKYRL